ncbi:hypothetical protein ACN24K_00040 [Streptomyces microflavus]
MIAVYEHFGADPERFGRFIGEVVGRFTDVVDQALARAAGTGAN